MSRYRRAPVAGATYFFTVNTYRRQKILTHPDALRALREAVRAVKQRLPFHVDALVVLPDHLHAVLTLPPEDGDFSSRLSLIKRQVAQSARHLVAEAQTASRVKRRELGFWQRRFWEHQIRDEADYARHIDYVHYNPVKHGLVTRVADWPYSTFHRDVRLGVYPPEWAGSGVYEQRDYGELDD
jgi:putative transposase